MLALLSAIYRLFFESHNYGKALENYINSHRPVDHCDVERLTSEWHRKQKREIWL